MFKLIAAAASLQCVLLLAPKIALWNYMSIIEKAEQVVPHSIGYVPKK
jgi:hypothetical protein